MKLEEVILVNEADVEIGIMEKMEVHRQALLHRAFSVFLFNNKGEMLLQRRAMNKYHSAGLWTNACCSHPRPGESVESAALRRTGEELGIYPQLEKAFVFTYKASFENGLTEHEYDHVFIGIHDGEINADPSEVSEVKYLPMSEIENELSSNTNIYTAWFQIAFQKLKDHLSQTDHGFGKPVQ